MSDNLVMSPHRLRTPTDHMAESVPARFHNTPTRAHSPAPVQPRSRPLCLECNGLGRGRYQGCARVLTYCPLHAVRPYQRATDSDIDSSDHEDTETTETAETLPPPGGRATRPPAEPEEFIFPPDDLDLARVGCPRCGARPGQPCSDSDGFEHSIDVHRERVFLG